MPSTKEKILDTALKLFNEKGLAQVSQRTVADALKISPGNLTYHFKKREDIIEALYYRLVASINQGIKPGEVKEWKLENVAQLLQATMHHLYTHRFFMIDFVQIMRAHPDIRKHFSALSQQRRRQFLQVINDLIRTGRMRPAELPGEYEHLYLRFQVFGDFWVASTVVREEALNEQLVAQYSQRLLQSLYPYLTEKGKEEFRKL